MPKLFCPTRVIETQPSRFVRHTRRCEAEFPVPISDAGACVPHTRRGTRVGAGCRPPHRRSLQKNPKKPSPRGIKEISRSNFSSLSRKKRASELRGPTVMSGAEPFKYHSQSWLYCSCSTLTYLLQSKQRLNIIFAMVLDHHGVLPFSLFVRTFCPCRLFYFGTKEATLRMFYF